RRPAGVHRQHLRHARSFLDPRRRGAALPLRSRPRAALAAAPVADLAPRARAVRRRAPEAVMLYPHRIRLVGPWEFEPLSRMGEQPLPPCGRMTLPARWQGGGLTDFAGRVRFVRRFGYP